MMRALRTVAFVASMGLLPASCTDKGGRSQSADHTTVRGPAGQKLTIVKPSGVSLRRGQSETVTINLRRENLNGDVTISIANLPAGVEAVDAPRATRENSVKVVLRAKESAALVKNYQALVNADGPEGIRATETLQVSIGNRS